MNVNTSAFKASFNKGGASIVAHRYLHIYIKMADRIDSKSMGMTYVHNIIIALMNIG